MSTLEDLEIKFQRFLQNLYQGSQPLNQDAIEILQFFIQKAQPHVSQSPHLQNLVTQVQHLLATSQAQQVQQSLAIHYQHNPPHSHMSYPSTSYQLNPPIHQVNATSTYEHPPQAYPIPHVTIPMHYQAPLI